MDKHIQTREFSQRIIKLQKSLIPKNVDACLIISNVNLYYYTGTVQNAYLYVPVEGEPYLFVRKNLNRAMEESPLKNVIQIRKPEDIKNFLQDSGVGLPRKLAMELAVLPVKNYQRLLNIFAESEVSDVTTIIREQRAVKSPFELELIKANGQKAAEVFKQFPRLIRKGMMDYELAAAVEYEFRKAGHIGLIRSHGLNQDFFFGQVLVGENGLVPPTYDLALGGYGLTPAFPVGTSGKTIEPDRSILIDYVANFNGYNVDITRTYSVGPLPAEGQRAYKVAQEIQEKIISTAGPGMSCEILYDLAVETASKYGLEAYFMGYTEQAKFVGHGIGLELNELPVLASKFKVELKPGMVIAIEPKFVLPQIGPVGLENTFVMGEKGLENLTPISEEIARV